MKEFFPKIFLNIKKQIVEYETHIINWKKNIKKIFIKSDKEDE